jgi:hypothetical protein
MKQLITRQPPQERVRQSGPPSIKQQGMNGGRDAVIRFGRCCVLPRARQLLVDGQPIGLGGRAFDLLPGPAHFTEEIIQAFYDRIYRKPETTFGNVKANVLAVKDPSVRPENFWRVLRDSCPPLQARPVSKS